MNAINDLINDLNRRINPAYANQLGTESYERRIGVEALEVLRDEVVQLRQRIKELEAEPLTMNTKLVLKNMDLMKRNFKLEAESAVILEHIRGLESAPRIPDGWLSIETAPKDGTRILLNIDHGEWGDNVWTGLWTDGWTVSYGKVVNEPTHWMPLPAAPKQEHTP